MTSQFVKNKMNLFHPKIIKIKIKESKIGPEKSTGSRPLSQNNAPDRLQNIDFPILEVREFVSPICYL